MSVTDDRTTEQSLIDFLSDTGSGGVVQGTPGGATSTDKPVRTRQLRATFRSTPSFAPHRSDGRAPGTTLQTKRIGSDPASTPPQGANDLARRNATIQAAIDRAVGKRSAVAADASPTGGRLRGRAAAGSRTAAEGRRGHPLGTRKAKEKSIKAGTLPLPAAIAKLVPKIDAPKTAPKLIPTETERSNATCLFREIGQRFNENRKKSKTAAYAGYRHDLMDNMDTLIMGGAIDLKEVTTVITGLEQYTKETEAESTETPATILGRWLCMDAAEVVDLEVVVVEEEAIDANDQSVEVEELEEVDVAAESQAKPF